MSFKGILRRKIFSALRTRTPSRLEVAVRDVLGDAGESQFSVTSRKSAYHALGPWTRGLLLYMMMSLDVFANFRHGDCLEWHVTPVPNAKFLSDLFANIACDGALDGYGARERAMTTRMNVHIIEERG